MEILPLLRGMERINLTWSFGWKQPLSDMLRLTPDNLLLFVDALNFVEEDLLHLHNHHLLQLRRHLVLDYLNISSVLLLLDLGHCLFPLFYPSIYHWHKRLVGVARMVLNYLLLGFKDLRVKLTRSWACAFMFALSLLNMFFVDLVDLLLDSLSYLHTFLRLRSLSRSFASWLQLHWLSASAASVDYRLCWDLLARLRLCLALHWKIID